MLTINLIRENKDFVIERLRVKNFDATETVDKILELDQMRREIQSKFDQAQGDMNRISKEIGIMMKEGRKDEAARAKEKTGSLKEETRSLSERLTSLEDELKTEIIKLPNLPHNLVAPGQGADDNVKVREGGVIPVLPEGALAHWDLIKKYDIIDFDLGTKLTGAGFPVYKGKGARLERSLISFFSR